MSSIRNIVLVLLILTPLVGRAEYATGSIAAEWDPVTQKFKKVYKDWQEGVVFDPATGDYTVTYKSSGGFWNEVRFEPATKIAPTLKSRFKHVENTGLISYQYRLMNGADAKRQITGFSTIASSTQPGAPATPPGPAGWQGIVEFVRTTPGMTLGWGCYRSKTPECLLPSKSLSGFQVDSVDLPGAVVMKVRGSSRPATWLGEVPEIGTPVGDKVAELMRNDFVPRYAAAPKIPNPTPFNAAVVLEGVRNHLNSELLPMKLVDPVFAGQLDRSLGAALEAVKIGNVTGAKDNLKQFRVLLKKEHEDVEKDDFDSDDEKTNQGKPRLIDRLAARVLDFNAKYVLKRMGGE